MSLRTLFSELSSCSKTALRRVKIDYTLGLTGVCAMHIGKVVLNILGSFVAIQRTLLRIEA